MTAICSYNAVILIDRSLHSNAACFLKGIKQSCNVYTSGVFLSLKYTYTLFNNFTDNSSMHGYHFVFHNIQYIHILFKAQPRQGKIWENSKIEAKCPRVQISNHFRTDSSFHYIFLLILSSKVGHCSVQSISIPAIFDYSILFLKPTCMHHLLSTVLQIQPILVGWLFCDLVMLLSFLLQIWWKWNSLLN